MSGLEVAGVVLGAIPIVIAAIDIYRERQVRIAFRNKEPHILRFIQALKAQHYLLQHDIERILDGAGVEHDTSSSQISPTLFCDSLVKGAVKGFLGKNADVYFDAVQGCHMVLAEVVGSFEGLGPKDLGEFVSIYSQAGSQYGLPKKIKFPLNRHDLNQRIWELDQATTTLRRISKTVSEEQPHVTLQPSSHEAAAFASAINKVRRHARHLYLAISTAYSTRCHAQHEARLILRNRSDLIRRYKSSKVTGTRALAFTVMLSPALSPSGDAPSYQTDITVADNDNSSDSTTQPYSKVIIRVPPSPRAPDPPRTAIENLCASIQQARDGNVILDLHLLAGKGLTHCHLASSSSEESVHLVAKRDDFVSLEVLLQETASKWLPGHRIVLSSIVASSILQLVSTPWLPLPLTSRSIWFTRTAVVSSNPSSAPQPFVEQSFENKNTSDAVSQSCNVRDYMLELGILLLEIEHWQTIDDYQAERLSQGQSDLSTRYDLARTWAKGSGSSILAPHHEAIERCIDCTFATSGATLDWDDGVLRKSFAELVVRPFQENVPRGLR